MSLEDSFGDIVKKARRGQKISETELGRSAGLNPDQVIAIENYELIPDDSTIVKLAEKLNLKPDALLGMAHETYYPADPNLARWETIERFSSEYTDFEVNGYIVWDAGTREAVLFDTGTDFDTVHRIVTRNALKVSTLALTHTHGDHVEAMPEVIDAYHPVILTSPKEPVKGAKLVKQGDTFTIGLLRIEVRETDGHSPGGLSYVITGFKNLPDVAVVGDAVFAGSAGGAIIDYASLHSKIKSQIYSLPDDTLILPGHGPITTVGQERRNNPFAP